MTDWSLVNLDEPSYESNSMIIRVLKYLSENGFGDIKLEDVLKEFEMEHDKMCIQ